MTEIHGSAKPGFEGVRRAFAHNFELGLERGASAAVTVDGELVVDLWAGDADGRGTPWERDTIVNVYSTTKTMAAISLLVLADRGGIDFAAPVARYWPEFGQRGKQAITISQVMSHSTGLSGFDPVLEPVELLYDWDTCCEWLAAQAPWWEPGTRSGYHAVTQGYLQGEILRRVTGHSLGEFFREEIAGPLGADFHIGLPEQHDARVAELVPPDSGLAEGRGLGRDSIAHRTLRSVHLTGEEPATRAWRAAEIPAAGGIGNARSVARVHSALACGGEVDGVRILSPEGVERALEEQVRGVDLVLGMPLVLGNGFGLSDPKTMPVTPSARGLWWGGWGGSLCAIDLDARATVSYTMNKMASNLVGDRRAARVLRSAFEAICG